VGRLKQMRPRIAMLTSRVASATPAGGSSRRDEMQSWRAWYKTARWRRLRWSVLKRDLFRCRMCGLVTGDTSQLVADHVRPHRGDETLFWDAGNLQCLCKHCHDSAKQKTEHADMGRQGVG